MGANMSNQLTTSIVRVLDPTGKIIIGSGFLVSERHALTCAHVVAQALGLPEDTQECPTNEVNLDFFCAPGQNVKAKVVAWRPITPEPAKLSKDEEDIAVLEL